MPRRRIREPVSSYHAAATRSAVAGANKKTPVRPTRRTTTAMAGPPTEASSLTGEIRAKLFANGRSQAVRLPKEFRMPGTEVLIHREGDRVILEPVADAPRDAKGWSIGLWDELAKWREGLDLDDFQIEDDPVPEPIRPLDAD